MERMTAKPRTYVTTYCNHAHNVTTGKPISHECYSLPPKAIELEMAGKYAEANQVLTQWSREGKGSPRAPTRAEW